MLGLLGPSAHGALRRRPRSCDGGQELSSQGKRVERAFLTSKLKHELEHRTDVDQLRQKAR